MKKIILTVLVFACILGAACLSVTLASSNTDHDLGIGKNKIELIDKKQLVDNSGLYYFVARKEGKKDINVKINLPDNLTKEQFTEYKNKMPAYFDQIVKEKSNRIPVVITFSKALSVEEYKNFVKENDIDVTQFKIRTMDNGVRATLVGAPENGDLLPQDKLNQFLSKTPNAQFIGIISIEGTIESNKDKFNKIFYDKNVAIADVSKYLLEKRVKESNKFKELKQKDSSYYIDVRVPDFYWYIEDWKE
ncbi:hypothetical protein [Thermoflavimicrobium dichotomicum]|uniref:Lipoprotein n=1 Tax=Thermoflavimicrobium dichotomicum TaxID=46223 RepID=A0A1I3PDQ7_9BACL|nr:hypothetical protein [Thermoflavimicrobium dichotomicum]SFJ19146.1 hypothetical protein SAMN05421852_105175 [Thermoflavimicrobium dichotomicum]